MIALLTLLLVLIVALISGIVYLTKIKNSQVSKLEQSIKTIDADRIKLLSELAKTASEKTALEGRLAGIESQINSRISSEVDAAMAEWTSSQAKQIRADAKKRATSADIGSLGENFTPLLTELNPKDFRHMGDPVDFIYYEHYDAVRRREQDEVGRIIFLDTKVGKGQLTTGQRRIRDAIVAGRVYFAVFTPGKEIKYWPELPQSDEQVSKEQEDDTRTNE